MLTKYFSPTLHPELRLSHTEKEGSLPFPTEAESIHNTLFPSPWSENCVESGHGRSCSADCPYDREWHCQQQEHAETQQPDAFVDQVPYANASCWPSVEAAWTYTQWTPPEIPSVHHTCSIHCTQGVKTSSYDPSEALTPPEWISHPEAHDILIDPCTNAQAVECDFNNISTSIECTDSLCSCSSDSALTMLSLVSAAASALEQSTWVSAGIDDLQHLASLAALPRVSLGSESGDPHQSRLSER